MNANTSTPTPALYAADRPTLPLCALCGREISVLILAATPRNPRPHLVAGPAAYHVIEGRAYCADCAPAEYAALERSRSRQIADVAARRYPGERGYDEAAQANGAPVEPPHLTSRTRAVAAQLTPRRLVIRRYGKTISEEEVAL